MKTVNILGTEYIIAVHKISEDTMLRGDSLIGYCSEDEPTIVVADVNEEMYFKNCTDTERNNIIKKTLRHEILHAFLNESGLQASANPCEEAWSKNEEMIDWFAIQFPKILKAYKEADCL